MYYFLAFIFGLFGVLSLLRTIERLVHGAGVLPVQLLIAIVGLCVAILCVRKARALSRNKK